MIEIRQTAVFAAWFVIQRGALVAILLCGGDKRTQTRDIARALELAHELEEEEP